MPQKNILMIAKIDDAELIEGCRGRNKAKYQKILYDQFSPQMFAVCLFYTRTREDAEDVLQEGFIRVFTYIKDLKLTGTLGGWIRKIMIHAAIDRNRRYKFSNMQ